MARRSMEQDVAILDMPLPRKMFGTRSDTTRSSTSRSSGPSALDSSSEDESSNGSLSEPELESNPPVDTRPAEPNPPPSSYRIKLQSTARTPNHHPRFSRALSMPIPSQLSHLANPLRNPTVQVPATTSDTPGGSTFRELSYELADSVQMVIQNMLQLSPPHILDPAKEQVSACSMAIPTPYMSAMFTAMKTLNYISANMPTFCPVLESQQSDIARANSHFDIGELLQNVGDLLSGTAAQAGVELVLFHGDVALRHIWVQGDETGISYILSHIVRQILAVAQTGDSTEVGLFAVALSPREPTGAPVPEENGYPLSASPVDMEGPLQCTITISHKFNSLAMKQEARRPPALSTEFLNRLLSKVGATIKEMANPADKSHTVDIVFTLERGEPQLPTPPTNQLSNGSQEHGRPDSEPTLEQLVAFTETLRGKKVTLHASSRRSFARHLTSYLTSWGMDVSHASPEEGNDGVPDSPVEIAGNDSIANPFAGSSPQVDASASFVFIDDDITVLKQQLESLRTQTIHFRTRPGMPNRTRSSTHIPRPRIQTASPAVIVHFTSICNVKQAKDAIQSVLASQAGGSPLPDIMIIPKPAGPRRLLTALHTAVTKPVLDPFFSPIANTPSTPGSYFGGQHVTGSTTESFGSTGSPRPQPPVSRPTGTRSNSDRSMNSLREEHAMLPPSPLGMSDGGEYFHETTLGQSPSSGYILQSPEGKRTGIFFHPNPRGKAPTRLASFGHTMERDKGQYTNSPPMPSRLPSNKSDPPVTFSSLHTQSTKPPTVTPLSMDYSRSTSSTSTRSRANMPSPTHKQDEQLPSTLRRSSTDRKSLTGSPVLAAGESRPSLPRGASRQSTGKDRLESPTHSAKTAKPKQAADTNLVPPISVLIVDDNPINQTVLSTFMKKKKIKYGVANNGKEAVEKWQAGEFHLILMDIQMPIMDGIEATKEIRRLESENASAGYPPTGNETRNPASSPYKSSVIIVALTASSLQSDRVAALGAGCNDFLTKPVSLVWLNNKIIEWGSIKALQMWAEPGPALFRSQSVSTKNVADRLHVPTGASRKNAPPTISRQPSKLSIQDSPASAATLPASETGITFPASPSSQNPVPSPSSPLISTNGDAHQDVDRSGAALTEAAASPISSVDPPPSISTVFDEASRISDSSGPDSELSPDSYETAPELMPEPPPAVAAP